MPEPSPRNILILYADYGAGHRSASLALKAALERRYGDQVQATMVNPVNEKSAPEFLRKEQALRRARHPKPQDVQIRLRPERYQR